MNLSNSAVIIIFHNVKQWENQKNKTQHITFNWNNFTSHIYSSVETAEMGPFKRNLFGKPLGDLFYEAYRL